jgi:hypothetical protein
MGCQGEDRWQPHQHLVYSRTVFFIRHTGVCFWVQSLAFPHERSVLQRQHGHQPDMYDNCSGVVYSYRLRERAVRHCHRLKLRGETPRGRVALARERDTLRAGDSAFAGPRSPAPLVRGSTSDTGHVACTNFSGTCMNTRYPTPGRCWCQPYL